ncbi:hypothetical protein EYF80_014087 [Liparis tanakae]|uniref:Uncharacterized protein n=1 Tax=Liparis tanakae TaxID=230148 RepID=A0A4Z2IE72_9TELE|nr:hypothetical protein EYF80_014087 [Liparis tanakae]
MFGSKELTSVLVSFPLRSLPDRHQPSLRRLQQAAGQSAALKQLALATSKVHCSAQALQLQTTGEGTDFSEASGSNQYRSGYAGASTCSRHDTTLEARAGCWRKGRKELNSVFRMCMIATIATDTINVTGSTHWTFMPVDSCEPPL